MTETPRISLCMIVRDEEAFLERCLASAAPWVDELCIVDTGSTDGTVAIAERFGARVRHVPWDDSFAEARNASLEMATGDWILVLDADEELAPGSGAALLTIVAMKQLEGALLRLENVGSAGRVHVQRLFRNRAAYRYVGAVHERLGPEFDEAVAARGRSLGLTQRVTILHYGYQPEVIAAKDKTERMRRLYARAIVERPDDLYLAYKHLDFLRQFPDEGPALAELERALRLVEAAPDAWVADHEHCAEIFALGAWMHLEAGRVEAAGELLARGLKRCPPTPHLHYARGHVASRQGRWLEALMAFEACREAVEAAPQAPVDDGVATWKTALCIADALDHLGRRDEAAAFLRREHSERGEAVLAGRVRELEAV